MSKLNEFEKRLLARATRGKQVEAQVIKDKLKMLKDELEDTIVKVPPRFAGALDDFENWLDKTFPSPTV